MDENVADRVRIVLQAAGHDVIWTRDITSEGVADDVVATVAEEANAILISHDKDFKKIAPRIPNGQRKRFRRLSMIRLSCNKPRAADRMEAVLRYIEFDVAQRQTEADHRSIIEIKTDLITIWR